MIDAYKKFWKGYVDFTGRSTRSEYWWPVLCHILVMILLPSFALVIETALNSETGGVLSTIFAWPVSYLFYFDSASLSRYSDSTSAGRWLSLGTYLFIHCSIWPLGFDYSLLPTYKI